MFKESLNPYGMFYTQGKRRILREFVARADVVHCHDDAYPTSYCNPDKKFCVYHAHIGDLPQRYFASRRVRYHRKVHHACITNGYGRHFDEEWKRAKVRWGRLPDILDVHHPIYSPSPVPKSTKKLVVTFTYSNVHERGRKINAKCPKSTLRLIQRIRGVDLRWVHGVSFEESMRHKQAAHIVLDEIYSPYTHLASLEGASVGACVLTSYDDETVRELCECVGAPIDSYPFVRVTPETLARKIEHYRDNKKEAIEIGRRAREWMLRYYSPEALLKKYLQFYGAAK